MHQGKWVDAERELALARQVLQPSLKRAPDDPTLLIQMAYLNNNLGHVMEVRGQPETAKADYRTMLTLTARLFASHPDNPDYIQALSVAHANLGRLAFQRGYLATSINEYRADDAVLTQASARDPKNNDQRNLMMDSHVDLGLSLASIGDVRTAMQKLQQAINFDAEQVNGEARDGRDLAVYSADLARLKRLSGEIHAADALHAKALTIFAERTRHDPSDQLEKRNFADAVAEQPEQLRAMGHVAASRAAAQRALTVMEPMLVAQPD